MSFPQVYTVNGPSSTSSPSLPSWLTLKARPKTVNGQRKRQRTQRQLGQLELIQDFQFPTAAIKVRTTQDGQHVVATGTYKPMIRVWETSDLTEKFTRVTDAENVDFVMLSSDWTKSLHLQRDRSLQLHTQGGLHHTIRLPTYGRALGYHSPSADALVGCTGTEVYRFNLEEGRYMTPLTVGAGYDAGAAVEGVNAIDVNPRHGLWSFGMDGAGVVEFWDPRSRSALTKLRLPDAELAAVDTGGERQVVGVTTLASHHSDGLSLAVGTSTGHTLLYDLRSPRPFAVKDQGYGEGVRKVEWLHGDGGRVVSADSKVIKVWAKEEPSTNVVSLHPANALVDLHTVPSSGLMLVACDASPLSTYYIPDLGPAPRWASFLDTITEELADDPAASASAYSDFKFVDRAELDALGLAHLVGTPALRPYMHGYFMGLKLYQTARAIANPVSYDEERERRVRERLDKKNESRIRARREVPKVNKALAERLRKAEEREETAARRAREKRGEPDAQAADAGEGNAAKPGAPSVLSDPRFKELFENPDFEVDEQSREFALINPATAHNAAAAGGRRKTAVEDEEDESDKASSDGFSESGDDDDDQEGSASGSGSDESDDGNLLSYDPRNVRPSDNARTGAAFASASAARKPRLVAGAGTGASTPRGTQTLAQRLHAMPAASARGAQRQTDGEVLAMRRAADGGMEMSYVPSAAAVRAGKAEAALGDEYTGGEFRRRTKVEKFGAGLERGHDDNEGSRDKGRTQRRHPGRSASKNAFRRR
ncbi:Small ribosomal subunit biogenesis [Cryptotrichosporon argae]